MDRPPSLDPGTRLVRRASASLCLVTSSATAVKRSGWRGARIRRARAPRSPAAAANAASTASSSPAMVRSEEHTSELQSRLHLVCRLLLEKKKKKKKKQ